MRKPKPYRYIDHTIKRYSSLLKKLKEEGKINEEFEVFLNGLSLEEVIALKLDLSSRTLKSPLYGLPLWYNLHQIVEDAIIKFAVSTTRTSSEAARVLGLSQRTLFKIMDKFFVYDYFGLIKHKGDEKRRRGFPEKKEKQNV
jgi:transcriptional regulator of acetoin/glycerol metabolism